MTTVATLSKGSGTTYSVGNQRAFEPWGSVFDSSGLSNTPKQAYCASIGHVADSELGLTYMRARYYEPSTGRFVSEDPARDGLNWFVYCNNNPATYADFTGKSLYWFLASLALLYLEARAMTLDAKGDCIAWFRSRAEDLMVDSIRTENELGREAIARSDAAFAAGNRDAGEMLRGEAATHFGEAQLIGLIGNWMTNLYVELLRFDVLSDGRWDP